MWLVVRTINIILVLYALYLNQNSQI